MSPGDDLGATLAELERVLGTPSSGARADTPLTGLGADPLAVLLWADAVDAHRPPGARPLDLDALARARLVGDLAAALAATTPSGTMVPTTTSSAAATVDPDASGPPPTTAGGTS